MKRHKYNARRAYRCGKCGYALLGPGTCADRHCDAGEDQNIEFSSQAEAKRWDQLRFLERAGKIEGLKRQTRHELNAADPAWSKVGDYVSDFQYRENGKLKVEDVKGFDTPLSKWKRKHCELQYGIKIDVIKA